MPLDPRPWLPLLLPHPGLFNFLDAGPLLPPAGLFQEILVGQGWRGKPGVDAMRLRDPNPAARRAPFRLPRTDQPVQASGTIANLALVSLPHYLNAWIVDKGYEDRPRTHHLKAWLGQSLLTWTCLPWNAARRPACGHLSWGPQIAPPDLSDLDPATPAQVLIPLDLPSDSAHGRARRRHGIAAELACFAKIQGWGAPLPARVIGCPRYFA